MSRHKVTPGDCIHSIADSYGHFWETVWSDPENTELRRDRESPSVLQPGDEVFVPDIRVETEEAATEKIHRYRRRGVPVRLRLVIKRAPEDDENKTSQIDETDPDAVDLAIEEDEPDLVPEEPWPNASYVLRYEGTEVEGTTDDNGMVEILLPPAVKNAELVIAPASEEEMRIPVRVGGLDPISTLAGVKQRLRNLGYGLSAIDDEEDLELRDAIRAFQLDQELDATGTLSDELRGKIESAHGS